MEEKRKAKRLPIKLELTISQLFKQDNITIPDVNESIEVINISKIGIGFSCKSEIPEGYYFDANIQLPKSHFLTVIKIVRIQKQEDSYLIGGEFVGLGDILSRSIDEYELEL